jgi:hypothetical protein
MKKQEMIMLMGAVLKPKSKHFGFTSGKSEVRRLMKGLTSLMSVTALSATALAYAHSAETVRLRGLAVAGSGCPAGSVMAQLGADGETLELGFSEFIAEVGPGIPLADSRRFCNLTFVLDVPSDQQYAIREVSYDGFAYLENGAGADLKSSFFFAGRPQELQLERKLNGSFNDHFSGAIRVPSNELLWSECGGDKLAALTTSVRVYAAQGSGARGYIAKDNLGVNQRYALAYRSCR